MDKLSRRDAVKASAGAVAGLAAMAAMPGRLAAAVHTARRGKQAARIRFAVIGANHNHIFGQVGAATRGGGEFVAYYVREPEIRADFAKRYPNVKAVADERAILEDPSIQLVLSSIVPIERAPLGVRVMQHGKDYMSDKPGIITMAQLAEVRRVQKETKRIYSILYSERLEVPAAVKAGELVKAGAIGTVVQTVGLGPHRVTPASRPEWFWDVANYGGILCDIGSHQCRPVPLLHRLHERRGRRLAGPQREPSRSSEVPGLRRHAWCAATAAPATSAWTGSPPTVSPPGATAG